MRGSTKIDVSPRVCRGAGHALGVPLVLAHWYALSGCGVLLGVADPVFVDLDSSTQGPNGGSADEGGTLSDRALADGAAGREDAMSTVPDATAPIADGGGTVEYRPPTLAAVTPSTLFVGTGGASITLTGTNFLEASVVKCNGTTLASSTRSATQISATVPANLLTVVGNLSITVSHAAPGGGTTPPQTLVVACDSGGVDYPLALGPPVSIPLNFTAPGVKSARLIAVADSAGADRCPATAATSSGPYLSYVVQNTTSQSVRLTAWAVCGGGGDAFLTFYNQPTLPTNLEQCTGYVSEGRYGTGGHASPEENGDKYCPGLVGADGLTLGACARAVVLIQPWDPPRSSPPTLKVHIQ